MNKNSGSVNDTIHALDVLRRIFEYNRIRIPARIYGKVNLRTDSNTYLSVYAIEVCKENVFITDITALIAQTLDLKLAKKGLRVGGTGHCHIQTVSEELSTLLDFPVCYEQLPSSYI